MIYLASDHAGFELKEEIKGYLTELRLEFVDIGPYEYQKGDDYPDYIIPAAEKVTKSPENRGIVIGHSGQGEALAANKVKGVRAALYYGGDEEIIKLSREHNNANVLALGSHFVDKARAKKVVKLWLDTDFSNDDRHIRRLKKIRDYEKR